ncbi:MAG: phosphotransferase [Geodermatophilaceae bacterium]|nr:phosphotransferase [Geodermatophilaceae bacterium]
MIAGDTTDLSAVLADWLPEQRWYPGKGRTIERLTDSGVVLAAGHPVLELHHVRIWYSDGERAGYLVPATIRHEPVDWLAGALIGKIPAPSGSNGGAESLWVYDALRDREQTAAWMTLLAEGAEVGPVLFRPEVGAQIPSGIPGDIVTTEQSNTSLVYGDEAILKVFRRLEPGINPDVEIHHALAGTENPHIAALLGSVEVRLAPESGDGDPDEPDQAATATAAMVQTFLPGATDGWSLASTSVRDLYAEADLHAEEVGGDFASESSRLGAATASVHADLARVLPTEPAGPDWLPSLIEELHNRLDKASEMVSQLEPYGDAIRATYGELSAIQAPVILQRVHGDLHLGQVLRTVTGWTILDFEGEPARSIAVRRGLDTPLRDVAGMLRSFDYAAQPLLVGEVTDPQLSYRATEWVTRNRAAYCAGYAEAGGIDPAEFGVLLAALEADKAIYETVYEARNRPHWLNIPLHSFERLGIKS